EIAGNDVKAGPYIEVLQILQQSVIDQIAGDVALEQSALERLEQVGFVQAQFGFHPVLGEEEDLAVGLPDAIAFHPFPPIGINGARSYVQVGVGVGIFQIEQAALDKSL